jgi:hypothetical protein
MYPEFMDTIGTQTPYPKVWGLAILHTMKIFGKVTHLSVVLRFKK